MTRLRLTIGATCLCTLAAHGQAVRNPILIYTSFHNQLNANTVQLFTNGFTSQLTTNAGAATDVSVEVVNDEAEYGMQAYPSGPTMNFMYLSPTHSTQFEMLSYYMDGSYIFRWSGGTAGTGSVSINQPFASGFWPSAVPRFTAACYNGAQGMNPSQPFTFQVVTPFTPSGSSEENRGGVTVRPLSGLGLVYNTLVTGPNATQSSWTMPANTLQPNTQYQVSWMFSQGVLENTASNGVSGVHFRHQTAFNFTTGPAGPTCDSIDFNNDTSLFDPQDIDAFLSVYSEGPCIPSTANCNDIDFNNDGSVFDPCDIDSFLLRFSEGPCALCG